jgi:hypothetical protein
MRSACAQTALPAAATKEAHNASPPICDAHRMPIASVMNPMTAQAGSRRLSPIQTMLSIRTAMTRNRMSLITDHLLLD